MTFADRCVNAFLGLALGDAYGRPLEFVTGERVRTIPVHRADLMWTDDTHMSLYLAEAVLAAGSPLDEDAFGHRVAREFVAWAADPLTPSTAPGNTCLAGVAAYEQSRDWRTSGVRHSDGCGAVMRIAPLAMALSGRELVRAAEVQALVTHAHVNAPEAAALGSWILRGLLEGRALAPALIEEAMEAVPARGTVHASLRAALDLAGHPATWLEEDDVPEGDGGWRSGSALGLGLLAAMRWGDEPLYAIDRAARIDGDSDSVACLAGLFLGAAGADLPPDWVVALPRREQLESLARRLAS